MTGARLIDARLIDHLAAQRERHVAELVELCSFASVSGSTLHEPDLAACAAWLLDRLRAVGLDGVRLLETGGNPLVYGEWLHAEGAPTVLVYGHYDVQPAEPLELWLSPPFEPTERDGRLYARGVSDNKGQLAGALAAIESLLAVDGRLPCNVRVLIDGEEETRADNLLAFLEANRETGLLAADIALVTDSSMLAETLPGVPIGLRGMAALELTVRTATADLHSGIYGGAISNALMALATLLAGLKDEETGRVLVDGFYDGVQPVPAAEALAWAALPFDGSALAAELGVDGLRGEAGFTTYERMWARPTLDVCGAWGGYQGEGLKTVIPAEAHAKLSCRIVAGQTPDGVLAALRRHLETHAPAGATVSIDWTLPGAMPILLSAGHPGVRAAFAAVAEGFEADPVLFRAGYSVPIVELLSRTLGLDSVLLGFMLPDENMHAPNEFVRLDVFARGIRAYAAFLKGFRR